jgi:phosphatidylinositol alpha 1,6-mannosyltransferase
VRIALFTDTFTPQVNGVARTLDRLVRHLVEAGYKVALVSPASPAQEAHSPPPVALHLPVPGVPFPLYPELLLTRIPTRGEAEALEAFCPEVVHCATESVLGWWGRGWALRRKLPLVTSFHTDFAAYTSGYGLSFMMPMAWELLRRFHAPAVRTLVPSHPTLSLLRRRGFHPRLTRWSRGVDAERFSPEHRDARTRVAMASDTDVVLLYVGRLAPEKRLPLLLEAFEQVRRKAAVRVGLVLVGGGPMAEALAGEGEGGSPPPGVHLAGYLEGEALARAYASADVFAFPSDTETFGNVVLEAMASGLPVVAVRRGGVLDSVRDQETGLLGPPGDSDTFARHLERLVEDAALRSRMGAAGRAEALRRGWPDILAGVEAVYRDARDGGVRADDGLHPRRGQAA